MNLLYYLFYFIGAFIPAMFLGLKVVGTFAGWTTDVKQETLLMKKDEYTIEATTDVLIPSSTLYDVQRIAKFKGKTQKDTKRMDRDDTYFDYCGMRSLDAYAGDFGIRLGRTFRSK